MAGGGYAGGNAETSTNGGTVWTAQPGDYTFQIWGPQTVAAAHGHVRVVSASTFSPGGDNLTWLDPVQPATWDFYGIQYNPAAVGTFIYIRLDCQFTNSAGGSGFGATVPITYSGRTGNKTASLKLTNTHAEVKDPRDTSGWGYDAYGVVKIAVTLLPLNGHITVALKGPALTLGKIAVKDDSCTIEYVVP